MLGVAQLVALPEREGGGDNPSPSYSMPSVHAVWSVIVLAPG